jgi:myosin heavy subunit
MVSWKASASREKGIQTAGFIDGHKTAQIILDEAQLDESTYKIGLSKVFFKADIVSLYHEHNTRNLIQN